jgi:hypothetical protein
MIELRAKIGTCEMAKAAGALGRPSAAASVCHEFSGVKGRRRDRSLLHPSIFDGGKPSSSVRSAMFIAKPAAQSAKLRRSGMIREPGAERKRMHAAPTGTWTWLAAKSWLRQRGHPAPGFRIPTVRGQKSPCRSRSLTRSRSHSATWLFKVGSWMFGVRIRVIREICGKIPTPPSSLPSFPYVLVLPSRCPMIQHSPSLGSE